MSIPDHAEVLDEYLPNSFGGYRVSKVGDTFYFGCGDVSLTRKEISDFFLVTKQLFEGKGEKFRNYQKVVRKLNDNGDSGYDISDIEAAAEILGISLTEEQKKKVGKNASKSTKKAGKKPVVKKTRKKVG